MTTINFIEATVLSGAATAAATQILKNPAIPIPANKYPRVTAAVIALASSGYVVVTQQGVNQPHSLAEWLALAVSALLVSALSYENILKVETKKPSPAAQTDTMPPVGL